MRLFPKDIDCFTRKYKSVMGKVCPFVKRNGTIPVKTVT